MTDLRAFMLYDTLPAGHIAFPVKDSRGEPHLRPGEFAVVDTTDTELHIREIYLIQWQNGGRELVSINFNTAFGRLAWWVGAPAHPWRKPGSPPMPVDHAIRIAQTYGCVDGPYNEDGVYLRSKLVGRVVGILGAAPADMGISMSGRRV